MRRNAFTLIELMIGVVLGTLVVGLVYATLRALSQSVTAANRIALENQLMRAGFLAALEEADFWDLYDDRWNTAAQRLRTAPDWTQRGLSFSPFASAFPAPGAAAAGPDGANSWDDAYDWPAADPRTWFRGNLLEGAGERRNGSGQIARRPDSGNQYRSLRLFGHYGLFAHVKEQPLLGRLLVDDATWIPYGPLSTPVAHTWLENQKAGLARALGWYGLLEYLPSNAWHGVLGDPGGDKRYGTADDLDSTWDDRFVAGELAGGDNGSVPHGIYRNTKDFSFFVIPPRFNPGSPDLNALRTWSWSRIRTGRHANLDGYDNVKQLRLQALLSRPMLATRPESWPEVTLSAMRSVTYGRFTNVFKIRWTSPITGELVELGFTAPGTTLRGARRMRGLD